MADSQIVSEVKNKENIQDENHINNSQIKNKEESQQELKKGQYILTPLESLLLNKLMPHGFKFESEENILKAFEASKSQVKRTKQSNRHIDNSFKSNNRTRNINYDKKDIMPPKRRTNQNLYKMDNIPNNISPEIYKTSLKCRNGLDKIKNTPWVNDFYQASEPDTPCLAKIEKKLNNYEYASFYDFAMDVRKIWYYFFKLGEQKNSDIYEKTSKMSDMWEKIYSEIENSNDDTNNIASNLKKRTEKIQKEYNEFKGQYENKEIIPPPKKIISQNIDNKAMSIEEKNILGNQIRSLNKEQLRGIIKILSDGNNVMNSKYFEFNIDKLSNKKLRELDKYVKGCLSINNNKMQSKNKNNFCQKDTQNYTTNDTDMNNKINNNQNNQNKNIEQKNVHKEENENLETKNEPFIDNKLKQNNKNNNGDGNESFSESDSISDSSLSN